MTLINPHAILITMAVTVASFISFLISDTMAFQPRHSLQIEHRPLCSSSKNSMNSNIIPISGGATLLKSLLQKPSKVLTVGLEFVGNKRLSLSSQDISTLSMQLRKSKVSAIWCGDIELLQDFTKEQETARGNFPGPCPLIFNGPLEDSVAAVEDCGASAVVVSVPAIVRSGIDGGGAMLDFTKVPIVGKEVEIVWKVSSVNQVQAVLEGTGHTSDVFWIDDVPSDEMKIIAACLPKGTMFIASVEPMQPHGAELEIGKEYKDIGCASIFVRRACVGDAEDLEYAQYLVSKFTSKASTEFKFTGLTGSTNGHFGGVQASGNVKWRRMVEHTTST